MQMMQWEDDALVQRAREIVSEQWPRLENNEIDEIVAVLIKAVVGFVNPCTSGVSHQPGNRDFDGVNSSVGSAARRHGRLRRVRSRAGGCDASACLQPQIYPVYPFDMPDLQPASSGNIGI